MSTITTQPRAASADEAVLRTFDLLRAQNKSRIALAYHDHAPWSHDLLQRFASAGLACIIRGDGRPDPALASRSPVPVTTPRAAASGMCDGLVLDGREQWDFLFRAVEPLALGGVLMAPAEPWRVVPDRIREISKSDALRESPVVEYVECSGLRGHYAEFGTFWGRLFFHHHHLLRGWLRGNFFAFDSFAGLSAPLPDETRFTRGDFTPSAYAYNLPSFQLLAQLVGVDPARLVTIPGFYDQSLAGHNPSEYGLAPESISVCAIDCDLLEPTRHVLNFITPLLEPGALIYFDDWRLCRASPYVGERAAALAWLRDHPSFELIEFHRDRWAHQWFIFQK
ncbi:MAG: hypothetical protein K8S99_17865 [Planctomycetes bacterium]|nr:hypothetical protein [Planctomycetota bacterium]